MGLFNNNKVQVSNQRSKYGFLEFEWKFDKEAIEKAVDELDLKLPVKIWMDRRLGVGGEHWVHKNKKHKIWISLDSPKHWANISLWHEFCHCIQSEQYDSHEDFMDAYNEAGGNMYYGTSYDENKFELEAIEFANSMNHKKLVKRVWI